ncbi:Mitochondrial protein C2orf69 [Formica fusca]
MGSKIWKWKNIPGIPGRCNDVLYTPPKLQPTHDLLVFFGGDVQDIRENMEKHSDSKKYMKWNLENTATILSEQFPRSHVFIVRPSRMLLTKHAVFSCFDNFVPGDKYGTPSFCPMHKALKHLRELLLCCLEHIKTLKMEEDIDDIRNIEATNLNLMGFSKGCAVLNQFLYEFHYYAENPSENININNFIKLIKSMWWLDGGHNGSKNTWITEHSILRSFAKLRINAHVHVTPYQVRDIHRPWIGLEENRFNEVLQNMEVSVRRTLHFGDRPRSLSLHFNILTDIGSNVE